MAKAMRVAGPHDLVQLAAGTYPELDITSRATADGPVYVGPAPGARVVTGGVSIDVADVHVAGLSSTGPLRLRGGATGSGFAGMVVRDSSVFVSASDSYVRTSTLTPAVDSDGIQVKAEDGRSPAGVHIVGNAIGPTVRGPKRGHVDCIQVLGGSALTIQYNVLFRCASQGLLVGQTGGGVVGEGILVERNVIQLCPVRSDACDGHNAVNISAPGARFVHNTVLDGSATFIDPSAVVEGNVFASLATCSPLVRYNVVEYSNCGLAGGGNVLAKVTVSDRTSEPPDAHRPQDAPGQGIVPASTGTLDRDLDGRPAKGATDAGAYQG